MVYTFGMKENNEVKKTKSGLTQFQIDDFSYYFREIYHTIEKLDRSNYKFGTDQELTYAEIHMIDMISRVEKCYVTQLARDCKVTKGAVSQLLLRLEEKKMIYRSLDPSNLSRKLIHLTEMGEKAFNTHTKLHDRMNHFFKDLFDDVTPQQMGFLIEFMNKFYKTVKDGKAEYIFKGF